MPLTDADLKPFISYLFNNGLTAPTLVFVEKSDEVFQTSSVIYDDTAVVFDSAVEYFGGLTGTGENKPIFDTMTVVKPVFKDFSK